MKPSYTFQIRKEAILVFCNLISTCEVPLTLFHVTGIQDFIENICLALKIQDANILIEVLEAIDIILCLDAQVPLYDEDKILFQLEIAGGLDSIESLQKHPNKKVFAIVKRIIETHFEIEETGVVPECKV